MHELRGRIVIPGTASGRVLKLAAPISFWGGVDPDTGLISDPRHPDFDTSVVGRVLAVHSTIGSSSSSAIMLELLRRRSAPAALLLGHLDAILVLGVIVARELGYPTLPVVDVRPDLLDTLPHGIEAQTHADGRISWNL
jgi:predicted aconitase with swiveling domain